MRLLILVIFLMLTSCMSEEDKQNRQNKMDFCALECDAVFKKDSLGVSDILFERTDKIYDCLCVTRINGWKLITVSEDKPLSKTKPSPPEENVFE